MPLRKLTPEDVLSFKNVEDAQISPDGTRVAYVLGDSFKSDTKWPKSNIWLVNTDGSETRQLTHGSRTDNLPRWSPDGNSLAFLSDRQTEGVRQVHLLTFDGGEAEPLTDVKGTIPSPRGLNALQWSPDGRQLAFLMEDEQIQSENDPVTFEQDPKLIRLWTIDLATREVNCVSPEGVQIWEFAWHPVSSRITAVTSDEPYEWSWYSNYLVTFALNGPSEITWKSDRQVALPVWSPDGNHLAFISSSWSDRGCVSGDLWKIDSEGERSENLTEGMVASIGWMVWDPDGKALLAIANERGGIGLHRLSAIGDNHTSLWWKQAAVAEAFWPRFSRSGEGTVAIALEDPDRPRDIWVGTPGENSCQWNQLTDHHPQACELSIGETSVHHWKGADGWEMQGLLIKPVEYEEGKSYPLVVSVHGGPSAVSGSRYYAQFGWCQLLANEGYAVFLPNYRGSVGWGVKFTEAILGDMGGKDFEDVLLGVDSLVETGIADADRLAVSGWSYGGYIAAWSVAQTNRFKASIMGAGISHWPSFHGKSCLAAWDRMYYQSDPYEPNGRYHRYSPLTYYENFETPTLILHGERDQDVPVEQSHLFFRALKDKGVPTELIVYPREFHGVIEKDHMLDMSHRVIAWFNKYL